MGMTQDVELTLIDKLNADEIKSIQLPEGRPSVMSRIEYSILTTQKRMYQLDLKRYKVAYYPSIAAYGAVSANALREEFDIFDSDKKWYPSVLIGATLSLNLFDGAQRESRIRQARLSLRKLENDIVKAENAFTLEASSAQTILQNALASFNSQAENLELATEIVRVAKIKYDQGVGTNLEVVDAETSFREAETNYYNTRYEVLVARVELDKAVGNIK
jgi:outer membrane protein TolC